MLEESLHEQPLTVYLPLVRSIARKLKRGLPGHVSLDDLYQTGVIGLLEAARRFRADLGVPFALFARTRIRGAMLDEIRRADCADRGARRAEALLAQAESAVTLRHRRPASTQDLAAQLGASIEAVQSLRLRARAPEEIPLDTPDERSGQRSLADRLADDQEGVDITLTRARQQQGVARAIRNLPDRERDVLMAWLETGASLKELGSRVGVGESQACRIRASAIRRLQLRCASLA